MKEIFARVLRYWYWFVLSIAASLVLAMVYIRYQTPVYYIESRFLIKHQDPTSAQGQVISQLGQDDNGSDVQNEIEVLKTNLLMKRVVRDLQLNVNIFSHGNIKSTELYKSAAPFRVVLLSQNDSVGAEAWKVTMNPESHLLELNGAEGASTVHWGDTVRAKCGVFILDSGRYAFPANEEFLLMIQPADQTAGGILGGLKVAPIEDGMNIIKMSLSDPVPERGRDILNDLYNVYVQANVEDQSTLADSTITFINNRLGIVSEELSGVEKNIEQFKSSNNLTDLGQQAQLVTTNANDLQKQMIQLDVQLEVLDAIAKQLEGTDFRVVPTSLQAQSPVYNSLVEKFNGLVMERDQELETTKPGNPLIVQLDNEIERIRGDLKAELKNIRDQMMINKSNLQGRINETMGTIRGIPSKQRTFLDISRQQEVKQQLYLFLLQKREETAISKSGTLSHSRLIDPAKSAPAPFSPNHETIYLSWLIAGLLIPAAVIYLKELANNKVREKRDITSQTDVPIIGEIGHNKLGDTLVVTGDSRSLIAEQFRSIRTNLNFIMTGKQRQVILVTSSMSGEGKSFFSLNLANTIAISGKKVVLLELDLRKPRLSAQLGLTNEQGVTNYIISNVELKYLPKQVLNQPNLYVINAGPIPPNPAELLMQDRMKALFEYLHANYDYIVIDTPPVGLVTDALLLSKYAGACLYVTRQDYTFKEQISIIEDLHAGNKMKGMAIILNDVENKGGKRYGYGYGYGAGNTSYYSDEEPIKKIWRKILLKN